MVIAVIHQPRYQTLNLFDSLVLLSEAQLCLKNFTTLIDQYCSYIVFCVDGLPGFPSPKAGGEGYRHGCRSVCMLIVLE